MVRFATSTDGCGHPECSGMPNTNNKIEGTFSELKMLLNNHYGMSLENCKRFISGFFTTIKEVM